MNTTLTITAPTRRWPSRIYVPVTALAVALVLIGFWPTYFGRLLGGTLRTSTLTHIHAAVYMGWLMLVLAQGYLAATGRTVLHVRIGRYAMAYGVLVVVVGLVFTFTVFADRLATGGLLRAQRFLLIPLTDMLVFSSLLAAAWVYRHKPEIHKRLIIVATTMLIVAGVGRFPFWHGTRIMTFREAVPFLLVWTAPIYLAMAHDYVRRRLIHPVYVMGIVLLCLVRMRALLIDTEAWLWFSGRIARFYLSAGS